MPHTAARELKARKLGCHRAPLAQQRGPTSLRAHHAVRQRVESFAAAVDGKHASAAHGDRRVRQQLQADSCTQGDVRRAVAHSVTGAVHGHEAGGARGVDAHARTLHAQDERKAAGRHGVCATSRSVRGRLDVRPHRHKVVPVGPLDTDEHACARAEQDRAAKTTGVQRLVADLEQQPLLRVHRRRLGARDAEAEAVKALGTADKAAVLDARRLHRVERGHVDELLQHPALGRHVAHSIATAAQHRIEGVGRVDAARATQSGVRKRCAVIAASLDGGHCSVDRYRAHVTTCLLKNVRGDFARRRLLEHERWRQRKAAQGAQPIDELGSGE